MKVVKIDLPVRSRGFTVLNADGSHTIVLNSRLSCEAQQAAYLHELHHIANDDWHTDNAVSIIESLRHLEGECL